MAPCISSCCGLPLQKAVILIGVAELVITIIATALNVTKAAGAFDGYGEECEGKDVCIGPIIKYAVFDSLFGIICSLLLIFGAHTRNNCMLISWMVVTIALSAKYIWVVVTHDWSALEDWISITYLLFYIIVYVVVIALAQEISSPTNGTVHSFGPQTTVITQNVPMQQQAPTAYPQQPYAFPPPQPQYPPYGPPQPTQQAYIQQPPTAPPPGY